MSSNNLTTDTGYQGLLGKISEVYATGQARAAQTVNVHIIETFYLAYPIGATLSHQLSWSHIVELLKIDDPLESAREEKP